GSVSTSVPSMSHRTADGSGAPEAGRSVGGVGAGEVVGSIGRRCSVCRPGGPARRGVESTGPAPPPPRRPSCRVPGRSPPHPFRRPWHAPARVGDARSPPGGDRPPPDPLPASPARARAREGRRFGPAPAGGGPGFAEAAARWAGRPQLAPYTGAGVGALAKIGRAHV